MPAAIDLRSDFDGDDLRRTAQASKDGRQVRQLLPIYDDYHGEIRSAAARIDRGVSRSVQDWAAGFNERGPDGLVDGKAPVAPSLLSADRRYALLRVVESGPDSPPYAYWLRKAHHRCR